VKVLKKELFLIFLSLFFLSQALKTPCIIKFEKTTEHRCCKEEKGKESGKIIGKSHENCCISGNCGCTSQVFAENQKPEIKKIEFSGEETLRKDLYKKIFERKKSDPPRPLI
jgi:hypothetical protein